MVMVTQSMVTELVEVSKCSAWQTFVASASLSNHEVWSLSEAEVM